MAIFAMIVTRKTPLLAGDESLTLYGHTDAVWCVAFNPDGKQLASVSFDRTLRFWNVETGKVTLTLNGYAGVVLCVAFGSRTGSRSG